MSLIIPTFKREQPLIDCLNCAFRLSYLDFEIVLVDQTPNHPEFVFDFLTLHQHRLTWLRPTFASVTKARNLGIQNSTGEFIVFIDDDTTFAPDFLNRYLDAFNSGYKVVQGRVLEQQSRFDKKPVWITRWGAFTGTDSAVDDGETNNTTGCNFAFHRSVLDYVEAFDENFYQVALHEDSDFGYRAYLAGYKIRFSSKAEVFHHKAMSGGHGSRNFLFFLTPAVFKNKIYFYRKNFPLIVVWLQIVLLYIKGVRHFSKMFAKMAAESRTLNQCRIKNPTKHE